MNVLLEISYVGSSYHGWQVQTGSEFKTVQGVLQDALRKLLPSAFELTGCSRTDAGVHALQYFCTVKGDSIAIPPQSLPYALNALLPGDISVISAAYCDDGFHPRYACRTKTYIYLYDDGYKRDPFISDRAWHKCRPLDENVMNEAAKAFVGTHDFSAFCAAASDVPDKTRTVYECSVIRRKEDSRIVELSVKGNGFLYNMVRIIAGTLSDVSDGKIKPQDIGNIILSGRRENSGVTAPACGLYLKSVEY